MSSATVVVTDLGPGNAGPLGPPLGTDPDTITAIAEEPCAERYRVRASNRFNCMDGRLSEAEEVEAGLPGMPEEAPAQIAGSLPVSEAAASYMGDVATHQPRSQVLAEKTRAAVADDIEVGVHGDEHAGEAGCLANAQTREALHFNAENADIVAAQTWTAVTEHGLDKNNLITPEDITNSIYNGKQAADNDTLWDITAEEAIAIMVANGATYEKYLKSHEELAVRIDNTENGAFAKAQYARDKRAAARPEQALSLTFGKLKSVIFERAAKHGRTEREAALETMRIFTFNLGLVKMLLNEEAKAGLINEST